jgi:hypothetical protein
MASKDNVLDWLNYTKMMDSSRELLVSDKWDVTFDKLPSAVYNPGSQALKFRLKGVDNLGASLYPHQPLGEGVDVRGFEIPVQPGQIKVRNQTVILKFIDYEDQSIFAFLNDWKFKCTNPVNQWSYRAEELRANLTFTRLNSQNEPVREYKMINAIIGDTAYEDPFDGDRSLIAADTALALVGVVLPPTILNIPTAGN